MRNKRTLLNEELTGHAPYKPLVSRLQRSSGRNNYGQLTVRHQGGGVKRLFRKIDFKRNTSSEAVVESVEYDPNRSAFISLIRSNSGARKYILAPRGIRVGDRVGEGENADINVGSCLPLYKIPVGSSIFNIELFPNKGAQLVRSAGCYATLMAKSDRHASVRLPSGEIRLVLLNCTATYGRVSNDAHFLKRDGKAGIKRKRNIRPTVRGSVMNAVDHKHGGGEGRAPIGLTEPRSVYGKKVNVRTRSKRKSLKHVVRARKR